MIKIKPAAVMCFALLFILLLSITARTEDLETNNQSSENQETSSVISPTEQPSNQNSPNENSNPEMSPINQSPEDTNNQYSNQTEIIISDDPIKSNQTEAISDSNETAREFIANETNSPLNSNQTGEASSNEANENRIAQSIGNADPEGNQYVSLGGITENNPESIELNTSLLPKENCSRYTEEGKKEIETQSPNCWAIAREESVSITNNLWIKDKKISSSVHIEDPVTVYADVTETEKQNIRVYWENENEDITNDKEFEVNFYDLDSNGLIDRISWKVPHLSEQYFKIKITLLPLGDSSDLSIQTITPESNKIIANPVEFKFNVNYSNLTSLNCSLNINNESFSLEESLEFTKDLQNGDYIWIFSCQDIYAPAINQTVSGNFKVNSTFSLTLPRGGIYNLGENVALSLCTEPGNLSVDVKNLGDLVSRYSPKGGCPLNLTINSSVLTKKGVYTINVTSDYYASPSSLIKNFSLASIVLSSDKKSLIENETVKFTVNISSPEKISWYLLDFNDSSFSLPEYDLEYEKLASVNHIYARSGNYTPVIVTLINGKIFNVELKGLSVKKTTNTDEESPLVNLIYPEDSEAINSRIITFSYNASDNVKVSNCTFELYNKSGSFGERIYNSTKKDISNGQKIEVGLKDFEEGNYYWEVTCYDNSSNSRSQSREIYVRFSNYSVNALLKNQVSNETLASSNEIDDLLSKINSFYLKEATLSVEEKEAVEDLGLHDNLDYYKKALMQDKKDLESGLDTMEPVKKESRKKEILDEIERIKKDIVTNIKVLNKEEYIKSSLTQNMEDIVKSYIEGRNITLSAGEIRNIARFNQDLQKELSVETVIKQIELDYDGLTKKITLITKKNTLKNSSSDILLESIPEEVANQGSITFLTENEVVKSNQLFEIVLDSEDQKIAYYIETLVPPKEIEKTDTLLFDAAPSVRGASITGFFFLDQISEINPSFYYAMGVIAFFVVFIVIGGRTQVRIKNWKKDKNAEEAFRLVGAIKKNLKEKDVEIAKENYNSLKKVYSVIPKGCKSYLYKTIEGLIVEINKKEVSSLLKEYFACKREGRNEDTKMIYLKIQEMYKKLPQKYKEKVYQKLNSV